MARREARLSSASWNVAADAAARHFELPVRAPSSAARFATSAPSARPAMKTVTMMPS